MCVFSFTDYNMTKRPYFITKSNGVLDGHAA